MGPAESGHWAPRRGFAAAGITCWLLLVAGNHAFEVLRTANQTYKGSDFISQEYEGVDFLVIEAKLPADGLSATENWCRDYQNLCAEYGRRPTGCGEDWAVQGGRLSHAGRIR
uniref:Uncharacterized protein n=1 Tax=Branchiostoma floridae TaxID=7739 RepID=C3ZCA0_BRAFL|eukprot:XP_002593861.1 hypothetical protein BRAFLDRAFT_75679 [Branchiostoma floridae]